MNATDLEIGLYCGRASGHDSQACKAQADRLTQNVASTQKLHTPSIGR